MKPLNHCCLLLALSAIVSADVSAEDDTKDVAEKLRKAKQELTNENYLLRYKYKAGETISYSVEHLATVDTTISGNNQKTKMRSRSNRSIHVREVTAEGHMKFEHVVDEVDMWSEVAGREAVRYNSKTDNTPPAEYEQMAKTIGIPISVITMDPQGIVVDRDDKLLQPDFGLGGLSIPLPKTEVGIGHKWSQPVDVKVRLQDKRIKTIKTRQRYQLKTVETGVATISIRTQVLTPVNDPRINSQLVQRICQGEIRFDLDAGRLLSRQLDWDEKVLGFNGPDSNMKYLARSTEKLIDGRTASRAEAATAR